MWDKRVVGQSVTLKRNPYYWQKGKPYLDSVTWTYVSDENTRELQLRGGQIQVDEFPPFNSITKLQNTSGVTMSLFPSTRTDYLDINEAYPPLADVHVRRAISYAVDRNAIIKSVLFGHGTPANSFLPPQVPFYDTATPGLQYDLAKAKAELAKSKFPKGFKVELLVGAGAQVENAMGQILQQALKKLGIDVTFKTQDTSTEFQIIQTRKYQLGVQLLDDGHRRPRRARHVRRSIRPAARSVLHGLQEPDGDQPLAPGAARVEPGEARRSCTRRSSGSRRRTRSWASSTTRRSAGRTRASCTASSSSRSATTTWRTPGSTRPLSGQASGA